MAIGNNLNEYVNKDKYGQNASWGPDGLEGTADDTGSRGTYDDEFGDPGFNTSNQGSKSDGELARLQQSDKDRRAGALGRAIEGGGDFSNDATEKRKRYYAWASEHGYDGGNQDINKYVNPGSADYGGYSGATDFYREQAEAGGHENDAAQAANEAAMGRSLGNMTGDRGNIYNENFGLNKQQQATRAQQIEALNLSRDAAMGRAPSEAAFQTRLGMNDVMARQSGAMGSARNLSALGGAQAIGSSMVGQSAGDLAMQGGLARSKEISDAIGMYGTQAGTVRDQDQARLGQNNQNAIFNAKANDAWKMGNGELLGKQGQLGVGYGGMDQEWMTEADRGTNKQFENDQRMAAKEAGADADAVGAALAKNREDKENRRQLANGAVTTGLTAVGTAFGGPAGGAAGAAGGAGFGQASKDWDW